MSGPLTAKPPDEDDDGQGNDGDGQSCMRRQDGQVEGPEPPTPAKAGRPDEAVIYQIGPEKEDGKSKGRVHAPPVSPDPAATDEVPTGHEQDGRRPVEDGMKGRPPDSPIPVHRILPTSGSVLGHGGSPRPGREPKAGHRTRYPVPGTGYLGSVQVAPDDGGIAQGWEYCYGHTGVGQEGNGQYGNQALIRMRTPGPAE